MRLDIAAVVVSVSGLEREQSSVCHLRFQIGACHSRPTRIGAGEQEVALLIVTILHEGKHIIELRKETFYREVTVPTPELLVKIHAGAYGVRRFMFEPFIKRDERHLASYCPHVQVLLIGLRSAVTIGITQAQYHLFDGRIADIGARRKNGLTEHVVFLQTAANQYRPLLAFPFVLHIAAI